MDELTIATVCARGGSKGVPNKHLYRLSGETLVFRAVRQARETGVFDAVAFSSDSPLLLEEAAQAGADVLIVRPPDLASDDIGKLPAIRHAVLEAEADLGGSAATVADLDASAPLRTVEDIRDAVKLVLHGAAPSVLTASPAHRSPYFNQVEIRDDGDIQLPAGTGDILARQASPAVFDLSGAIYVWTRERLFSGRDHVVQPGVRLHVIPKKRAWDIDEPIDLQIIGALVGEPLEPPDSTATET